MMRLGIGLLAIGAILAFAIGLTTDIANIQLIGYILMGVGLLALIMGMVQGGGMDGGNKVTTKRQTSDDGTTVVEEKRID